MLKDTDDKEMLPFEFGSELNRPHQSSFGELENWDQKVGLTGRIYLAYISAIQVARAGRAVIKVASIEAARRKKLESYRSRPKTLIDESGGE